MAECSAQPVTCQATRPDLERYLEQSQHGQNTPVFDCYFLPGTMPPRCAACHRLIAEHGSGAAAASASATNGAVFVGQPVAAGGGGPYPPVVGPQVCPVTLPIQVGDTEDVYTTSSHLPVLISVVFILLVALIIIIAFSAAGIADGGITLIGPYIMILTAFCLSWMPSKYSLTFDKENRMVHYKRTRYIWRCCCGTTASFGFDDIHGLTTDTTNVRVNGSPLMAIKATLAPSAGVPDNAVELQVVNMFEINSYLAAWQQYLGSIGIMGAQQNVGPATTVVNAPMTF